MHSFSPGALVFTSFSSSSHSFSTKSSSVAAFDKNRQQPPPEKPRARPQVLPEISPSTICHLKESETLSELSGSSLSAGQYGSIHSLSIPVDEPAAFSSISGTYIPEQSQQNAKNAKTSLSCYYTNATSLNGDKLRELTLIAATEEPHVMCITETWFDEYSSAHIDNYKLFRRDRGSRGGGVAIYVRLDIETIELSDNELLNQFSDLDVEQIWQILRIGRQKILVGCIYRSENNRQQGVIDRKINKIIKAARHSIDDRLHNALLITGDFNWRDIIWHQDGYIERTNACSRAKESFLGIIRNNFIHQRVTKPTFKRADGVFKNILDLVLTDVPLRIDEVFIGEPLGTANQDHLSLRWTMKVDALIEKQWSSKKLAYRRVTM